MEPTSQAEAERLLGIAEKLLEENDLNAARDFALLAQEAEPFLYGSDQIMAIADVLIAANKRINDNHHNWYEILQIEIHRKNDLELIKQQHRRLALLLHSDRNKFPLAGSAFKLVVDAWSVLSDPLKKATYDEKLFEFLKVDLDDMRIQKENDTRNPREKIPVRRKSTNDGEAETPSLENIWTPCPYCYNLYEYPRVLEGCCLRCANCDRAFEVVVVPPESMPPMVPGKDAYYWMPAMSLTKLTSHPSTEFFANMGVVPSTGSDDGIVDETPSQSRSAQKPQEIQAPATAGVRRKRGRPVKNPLS